VGNYGDPTLPTDPNALVFRVTAPADFSETEEATVTVEGSARAGEGPPAVTVSVGGGAAFVAPLADGAFSATVSLAHGENVVRVVAALPSGQRAEILRRVTYRGAPPGIAWLSPPGGTPLGGAAARVSVRATASVGRSITSVQLIAMGGGEPAQFAGGVWSADVRLPGGGTEVAVRARATDSAGETTETARTYPHDPSPPAVSITAPAAGTAFAAGTVEVSGTASDDLGLKRVEVRVDTGDPEPAEGTTGWTAKVYLEPGTHRITATAIDVSGQRTDATVDVSVTRTITLRPPNATGDLTLTLDRNGLDQLIPDDDEKRLTLLYVDLEPVLAAGLDAIKDPALAGIDTSAWGQAERNMQRLLNMSPDNADLRGTALEPVLTLAPNIGLPPGRLLADIAGVAVDQPFLASSVVAKAILRNLIETHPNIDVDPADGKKKVRATLYDALRNFSTLAPKFGPAGAHPGFLTGTTLARALKANFAMTVTARSNLTQHDGVNPQTGKGYLFAQRDPGRQSILEFDFLDPARFRVEGIADEPNVDMTFFMGEDGSGQIPVGTQQIAGAETVGGVTFYRGSSRAWDVSPWLFEHLVIDAVYQGNRARFASEGYRHTFRYSVGAIDPAATVTWDKGWISMTTAGGLGSPPPPAYFWDHLLEAAQKRLHDQGVTEPARMQFALTRIPLGLTGAQLKERLRPQMEAQKADLSRILLGDQTSNDRMVAFFRAKGTDGADYLYFLAPADIPAVTPYPYTRPGFFRDAALTDKASSTAAGTSGDAVHEKVAAAAGSTYFIRGIDGKAYRVELVEYLGADLHVRVTAVMP
jgi:hypothetical protein